MAKRIAALVIGLGLMPCQSIKILGINGFQIAAQVNDQELSPTKRKQMMTRFLKQAEDFFEKKKYEDALIFYTKTLKIAPDQKDARIKLARCLYQLERYQEAYHAFRSIGLTQLAAELRYEYGQSALKIKEFAIALDIFKTVPKGHAMYDIANYYAAICASNLKDYEQSAVLMRQAVILPTKLDASRKAYLKHIDEMLGKKKNDQGAKNSRDLYPKGYGTTGKNTQEESTAKEPLPPLEIVPKPRGFAFRNRKLELGYEYLSQRQDFEARGAQEYQLLTPFLKLEYAKDISLSSSLKPSHHMLLYLKTRVSHVTETNQEFQFLAKEERELRYLARERTIKDEFSMVEVEGLVMPEWEIFQDLWLSFGGGFMAAAPEADTDQTYLHLIGSGGVGLQKPKLETQLTVSWIDTVGPDRELYHRIQEDLNITLFPKSMISLSLDGRIAHYSIRSPNFNGPDFLSRIELNSHLKMFDKIFLKTGGHFQQIVGQKVYNINNIPVLSFQQSAAGGQLSLILKATTWLDLNLTVQAQDRYFENIVPDGNESRLALASSEPNFVLETAGSVHIFWQF